MSEISAAMGLTSFDSIELFIERNRENYLTYQQAFRDIPGIKVEIYNEAERNNFQYIIASVEQTAAGFTRDELTSFLHQHNVLVRRYFYPGCHRMAPYASSGQRFEHLRATEDLAARVISFPNGTSVYAQDIRGIAELIRELSEWRRAKGADLSFLERKPVPDYRSPNATFR